MKQEYDQDCTTFVSKAHNYGGGMKKRTGWYRSDSVWWKSELGGVARNSFT
ncbi:hypothetical protein [Streptomyces sp. NPDC059949]|uniref:hypothetical protein n=1 Tax=Streptomyces sp. NPDC059949 TaxID=3347013 RepID=UPI003656A529